VYPDPLDQVQQVSYTKDYLLTYLLKLLGISFKENLKFDVHINNILNLCSQRLYLLKRPRKNERLSWPGWLTYSGRFTHISGHPSATGRAQFRESSPAKDRRSTAVPRNQLSTDVEPSELDIDARASVAGRFTCVCVAQAFPVHAFNYVLTNGRHLTSARRESAEPAGSWCFQHQCV